MHLIPSATAISSHCELCRCHAADQLSIFTKGPAEDCPVLLGKAQIVGCIAAVLICFSLLPLHPRGIRTPAFRLDIAAR